MTQIAVRNENLGTLLNDLFDVDQDSFTKFTP